MFILADREGSASGLSRILDEVVERDDTRGALVLACDSNGFAPDNIDHILKKTSKPVFGGIFPGILLNDEKLDRGTIVAGLPKTPEVHVISGLSDPAANYEDEIDEKICELHGTKTMFVLVDGLAQRISALIASLFNIFGLEVNYVGGGAGSLSLKRKPCLFTNDGMVEDSALLVMVDLESGVGVSHGWEKLSGPYRVTKSDKNVIEQLDRRPALDVYRDIVATYSGVTVYHDNFFDAAKSYPFGISRLHAERVVRDPFATGDNGSLVCIGEVPEGSYVDILYASPATLIEAARDASQTSRRAYKGKAPPGATLFIDCISRVLYLENRFNEELTAVYDPSAPLIGALTIGEIANNGKDYLEFYNKTSVICALEG